jgi:hypothetical protein
MLGAIVGAIAKAILGALASLFGQRQTRADQVELGQQRQANAQHQAAAEATTRMQKAAAEPHDAATTQGRLKDGSF